MYVKGLVCLFIAIYVNTGFLHVQAAQCTGKGKGRFLCCDGVEHDSNKQRFHNLACCGTKTFKTRSEKCCNKRISAAPEKLKKKPGGIREFIGHWKCCDTKSYNPDIKTCCKGNVVPYRNDVKKSSQECCGIRLIDGDNQICCEDKGQRKFAGDATGCCGRRAYNTLRKKCVDGRRVVLL